MPLCGRAQEILEEVRTLEDGAARLIFTREGGKPLGSGRLRKLLRWNGIAAVPHGFRSSFRDWAAEETDHPREVVEAALAHVVKNKVEAGGQVAEALIAFRQILGTNDMLAYLSMMAPRLLELWRVLKLTGSLYLHCDPTASHYLKLLLDSIFGKLNFRNEITWQRHESHNDATKYGNIADVILYYSRGSSPAWNPLYEAYGES